MFVGRDAELARLQAHVERVVAGKGGLVLLTGEPGIGKTQLATRTAELAEERGLRVAWGRCWETGGAPAFWPWSQVFEALALADPFGAEDAPDGREARFRRIEGAARRLREAAPLVVLLDDLHAADQPSLDVLQVLARDIARTRLLVVGSYREAEARAGDTGTSLARIGREGDVIVLDRLRDADVRAWIEAEAPGAHASDVANVCAVSEGNPLFVREVLRTRSRIDARRLPAGMQAILDEHLARIDADVRELLAAGSVLGRELSIADAAALADVDDDEAASRLARACTAGIVEPRAGGFAFSHVLLRDRLYTSLAPSRRASLHRRAGERLADTDLARAAHHLIEGHDRTDVARLAQVVRDAARVALRRHAFEEAASLAERALALPGLDDQSACELELMRGEALIWSGELERGQASCSAAAARARGLGSAKLLSLAGLASGADLTSGRSDVNMVAVLREALAGLPAVDDILRARVTARLACALTPPTPDTFAETQRLARDAVAMARRIGDHDAIRYVIGYSCFVMYYYGTNDERRAMIDDALRTTSDTTPLYLEAFVAFNLRERGDLASSDRAFDRCETRLRDLSVARYAWCTPMLRATRALLAGDLDAATELGSEARELAARHKVPIVPSFVLNRISIAQARGEPTSIAADGDALLPELSTPFVPWLLAAMGRHDEARARIAAFPLLVTPTCMPGLSPPVLLAGDAAIIMGDVDLAARYYEALLPQRSATALFWGGRMGGSAIGPAAYVAGGLARLLGKLDEARSLYDEAIAICDRLRAVPHARLARRAREQLGGTARAAAGRVVDVALARSGEQWTLAFEGRSHALKARRGLDYLAQLIESPRRDVHVLELSGSDADDGKGAPLLDAKAKAAYKTRVDDLREAIDAAEARNDYAKAERARAELDALATELSRAVALGGRDRTTTTAADRARAAVTLAIRRAIEAIAAVEPALGGHLQVAIRTGQFCSYEPDPRADTRWKVTR